MFDADAIMSLEDLYGFNASDADLELINAADEMDGEPQTDVEAQDEFSAYPSIPARETFVTAIDSLLARF